MELRRPQNVDAMAATMNALERTTTVFLLSRGTREGFPRSASASASCALGCLGGPAAALTPPVPESDVLIESGPSYPTAYPCVGCARLAPSFRPIAAPPRQKAGQQCNTVPGCSNSQVGHHLLPRIQKRRHVGLSNVLQELDVDMRPVVEGPQGTPGWRVAAYHVAKLELLEWHTLDGRLCDLPACSPILKMKSHTSPPDSEKFAPAG